MTMFYKFIISFIALLSFSIAGESCLISIFDCAQGNAVAAKYGNETMVFDAGRAAHSRFVQFENNQSHESELDKVYEVFEDDGLPLKRFVAASPEALVKPKQDNCDAYQECFEESFKGFVLGEDNCHRLKAVFSSHPDKDHYNLIAKFGLEPEAFILGGLFAKYKCDNFKGYVGNLEKQGKSKVLYDKNYGKAKPYKRFMTRYNEDGFEELCRFGKKGDTNGPQIEILSANVGNSTQDAVKNQDSLIVRVKQQQSILITGDGEETTFKAAENNAKSTLQSDILIISHHGSKLHGCTSSEILKTVKPKCCVISAGFGCFRGQYHPSAEAITTILDYYKNDSRCRVEPHYVSYYLEGTLKSIITNAPLFTTIDNGTLTFDLSSKKLKVTAARDFWPVPSISLEGTDGAKQPINISFNTIDRAQKNAILSEVEFNKLKVSASPYAYTYAEANILCKILPKNQEGLYYKSGKTYLQVKAEIKGHEGKPIKGNVTLTHKLTIKPISVEYKRGHESEEDSEDSL